MLEWFTKITTTKNKKQQQINDHHLPSTERAKMRYPNARLPELDVTMATQLTGPIDRDDNSNKMEEQTAAEMQNPDNTNCHWPNGGADCCINVDCQIGIILTTQTAADLMPFFGVCGAGVNEGDVPQWKITLLVCCFLLIMLAPAVLILGVSCGYLNISSFLLFLIMLILGVSCGYLNIRSFLLFPIMLILGVSCGYLN